jgi:Flp pilus assembly protein TadD
MEELLLISKQAIETNDSVQASQALGQAIQYASWRDDLRELAGIWSFKSGNHHKAQEYLQQVNNFRKLSAAGLTALGDIAQAANDPQTAVHHWEEALEADGPSDELHSRLATTYRQLGELENAIQHQSALVRNHLADAGSNYSLGLMLAASQPESALAYLTLTAELDPNLSENSTIISNKIRAARIRDDQAYLLVSAGQALASIAEWDLAIFALTRATELNPGYAEAWTYLGEALEQVGEDGSEQLEHALALDPDSLTANTLMGLYWQRKQKYGLALTYLYAAAQLDEPNPVLQTEIGNTLGLMGDLTAAESHYRRAVEYAPRDPTFWQSLANFYTKYEFKLEDEGLTAARQAVLLNQNDPTSLDLLGQIYLLLDSPHIAKRFILRALENDPQSLPANLHLGLLHILEGNTLEAYRRFSLVQSLAPEDSPISEQARRLLDTYFP